MAIGHMLKSVLIIALILIVFSVVFSFLFKVGLILLIVLGAIYLIKKILE